MKKLTIVLFALSIVFSTSNAWAADGLYTPSVLPNSPFYFFKSWKESVELFFTLSSEKKVEVLATQAGRRLAESYALLEKNLPNSARAQILKYGETYNHALAVASNIKNESARNTVLENLSNNTGSELRVMAKIYDAAPEGIKKDVAEMLGTVSKTQGEIVKSTPVNIRTGILKKIEAGRAEVVRQSSGSAKTFIPTKILIKD